MLQKTRLEKGLSQGKLAKESGVNIRTIQSYESGARNIDSASLDTLTRIASALDCRITDILESDELKDKCKKVTL